MACIKERGTTAAMAMAMAAAAAAGGVFNYNKDNFFFDKECCSLGLHCK